MGPRFGAAPGSGGRALGISGAPLEVSALAVKATGTPLVLGSKTQQSPTSEPRPSFSSSPPLESGR